MFTMYDMSEMKFTQAQVALAMFDKARINFMRSFGYSKFYRMNNMKAKSYSQEIYNEFSKKKIIITYTNSSKK